MKKFLSFFIITLMVCAFAFNLSTVAYAGTDNINLYDEQQYSVMVDTRQEIIDFVYGQEEIGDNGERTDRTAGTKGEREAADYLEARLSEIFGYNEEDYKEGDNWVEQNSFEAGNDLFGSLKSQNVVGYKKPVEPSSDVVIIGAHYDNAVTNEGSNKFAKEGHGIFDNAGGVAAVLNLAQVLIEEDLPYHTFFVFYGGEEQGLLGSQYFLKTLAEGRGIERENILLAINLDSIGVGDELFMYADETSRIHYNYIKNIASQSRTQYSLYKEKINDPPTATKPIYGIGYGALSYLHMGLASDNAVYVGEGINSINFFSAAWNAGGLGFLESEKHPNFEHTARDNLLYIEAEYGDKFYNRINQITLLVVNTLLQEDFTSTMQQSHKQSMAHLFFLNSNNIKMILIGIIVLAYIILTVIIRKKRLAVDPLDYSELKKAVMENRIDDIKKSDL